MFLIYGIQYLLIFLFLQYVLSEKLTGDPFFDPLLAMIPGDRIELLATKSDSLPLGKCIQANQ